MENVIETEIGTVRKGKDIGKNCGSSGRTSFVWAACTDCGARRWTEFKHSHSHPRCTSCAAKRRQSARRVQENGGNGNGHTPDFGPAEVAEALVAKLVALQEEYPRLKGQVEQFRRQRDEARGEMVKWKASAESYAKDKAEIERLDRIRQEQGKMIGNLKHELEQSRVDVADRDGLIREVANLKNENAELHQALKTATLARKAEWWEKAKNCLALPGER